MDAGNSWNDLALVLGEAQRLATAYRRTTPALPVAQDASPDAIRRRLARYTFDRPIPAEDLLADVADLLER